MVFLYYYFIAYNQTEWIVYPNSSIGIKEQDISDPIKVETNQEIHSAVPNVHNNIRLDSFDMKTKFRLANAKYI